MSNFFISTKAPVPMLVLTSAWSAEAAAFMIQNRIVGLRLSGYLGWESRDLNFLQESPFVEYLEILTTELSDVRGLYLLKQLKYLYLEGKTPPIRFYDLPRLQTLALGKVNVPLYRNLLDVKSLRKLSLAAPHASILNELGQLTVLQDLGISRTRIVNLGCVGVLPGLRKLSLVSCNSLVTLKGIETARHLVVLYVEQARHLKDVSSLASLHLLRTLVLNQCPEIESIGAIAGLPQLETVGLMQTTNVRDGDLTALKALPKLCYASFINREHYSSTNEEFPKAGTPYY